MVDVLAKACDSGVTGMPSGRFFGMVIGGTHPVALAADWVVSSRDQNCVLRQVTPAHSAVEDMASAWVLDLLGLPSESAVGFVTGVTTANFAGLAAGRTIMVLQAGNLHSGAFDLWAAASPAHRTLMHGCVDADSWATDAHETLNVPYDSGLAIVRDTAAPKASMGMHGGYLIHDEHGDPIGKAFEMPRRAGAFAVWAVLRALGRHGVAELVDRLCSRATAFAAGLDDIVGATVLNHVDFTPVCVSCGSDERTEQVVRELLADGTAWTTGSRSHDRSVLRISASNWSTTDDDVRRSLDAVRTAAARACPPGARRGRSGQLRSAPVGEGVVLVRRDPAAVVLAEPDGEPQPAVGVRLEVVRHPAPEPHVGERDVLPGRDLERDEVEPGASSLPGEERRPGLAVGLYATGARPRAAARRT